MQYKIKYAFLNNGYDNAQISNAIIIMLLWNNILRNVVIHMIRDDSAIQLSAYSRLININYYRCATSSAQRELFAIQKLFCADDGAQWQYADVIDRTVTSRYDVKGEEGALWIGHNSQEGATCVNGWQQLSVLLLSFFLSTTCTNQTSKYQTCWA